VSRPRKPFGKEQPGRLQSTMMKVLAAEMADPERLRRGKRLAKDGSVLDIVIEPGTVVCEIQGSRPTPYVATLEVSFGDGMPLRRDVDGHCTCPDADNLWGTASGGSDICKHTVAAMYTLADELLIQPELLDLWRGQDRREADSTAEVSHDHEPTSPERSRARPSEHPALIRRHLRVVGGTTHDDAEVDPAEPAPVGDRLASLLTIPPGATLPEVGSIERMEPVVPPRRDLAAVIRDAVENLRIEWD
jgi:hypothetical protein